MAGSLWDPVKQRWYSSEGRGKKRGLPAVGAAVYAEDSSTEVIALSYKLPDANHPKRWKPGDPLPEDLFEHIAAGGLVSAHHVMFERLIWFYVCVVKYGFPELPPSQLRCSMATANVNNYPGSLDDLGKVLQLDVQKDKEGKRLIDKFSQMRNPTKADPSLRIWPHQDPEDAEKFYAYCDQDVLTEVAATAVMPPMTPAELRAWQIDQDINWRGVGIDVPSVEVLIHTVERFSETAAAEFSEITGGLAPTQVGAFLDWLKTHGVEIDSLSAENVEAALDSDLPAGPKRALEIRAATASASIKKLYAMRRQVTRDGRLVGLFRHHGTRTGRPTGGAVQPTNLPKAGPKVRQCTSCQRWSGAHLDDCHWCGSPLGRVVDWEPGVVPDAIAAAHAGQVEQAFGEVLPTVRGCLRGLFVARAGHDLVSADYASIEAVVLAALAGEEWRLETFRRGDDIYLASASRITNTPMSVYDEYFEEHGKAHPHRQMPGKIAELALGYGGWLGAWRNFDENTGDDEAKQIILGWRNQSPAIVEFWGGQQRGSWNNKRWDPYGCEGMFVQALLNPGTQFDVGLISFIAEPGLHGTKTVWMTLPSGRRIPYHEARLALSERRPGQYDIFYTTWNTNPKMGPRGWVPMKTYAGRLAENATQATAHDVQRFGIANLEAAGYPVVLHVYDEMVSEVPEGFGSREEFVETMRRLPDWAKDWPITTDDGWRDKRYRKG